MWWHTLHFGWRRVFGCISSSLGEQGRAHPGRATYCWARRKGPGHEVSRHNLENNSTPRSKLFRPDWPVIEALHKRYYRSITCNSLFPSLHLQLERLCPNIYLPPTFSLVTCWDGHIVVSWGYNTYHRWALYSDDSENLSGVALLRLGRSVPAVRYYVSLFVCLACWPRVKSPFIWAYAWP